MSSAKLRSIELTIDSFMSLIKIMKRIGPRTVPWGTPLITLDTDDFTPFNMVATLNGYHSPYVW